MRVQLQSEDNSGVAVDVELEGGAGREVAFVISNSTSRRKKRQRLEETYQN